MKNKIITIGIIGGTGVMGRWFEKFFTESGHKVLLSGRKTALTSKELAKQSNIVIISVPIDVADHTAEEVGHLLNEEQLLTDFCSLKEDILKSMMNSTKAEVVGMHPLFGPFMDTIQGQNIIFCPGRGRIWFDWLKNEFQSKGANIREMDATSHDRNMAVFQGLIHIMSVSMGRTLQKMNLNPAEAISYSTPVFRINVDLVGRLFAQDLGLYEKLIGKNKYVKEVVDLFLSSMNEGRENLLENQDENRLAFLEDIQSFLGDFCQQGLKESNQFLNLFYTKPRI